MKKKSSKAVPLLGTLKTKGLFRKAGFGFAVPSSEVDGVSGLPGRGRPGF
jgi:hypothetical protein